MARPLRVEFSGACYHVLNRGNYRSHLFEGKGAAEAFERTLGEAAERFGWGVHAYVVMRNHFHLAVQLGEPNLSEGMHGAVRRSFRTPRRLEAHASYLELMATDAASDSTPTEPSTRSTALRTIASPMPVPAYSDFGCTCWNMPQIRG